MKINMKKELTKQNNKLPEKEIVQLETQEIIQCIDKLITEGINVKKQANPNFLKGENAVHDLYKRELFWYEEIKELWFNQNKLYKISDIRALYKAHEMILPLGGLEYRDKKSKKSQKVLKQIKINADKVSDLLLKELKPKLLKIVPEGSLYCNGFKFDLDLGRATYGETKTIFKKHTAMYKLLVYFLKNKNEKVGKEKTLEILCPIEHKNLRGSSRYSRKLKDNVNNIRKKLDMSGKNKKNEDLFESTGNGSYKLICEE